ncbi:MAG: ABC transporter substrate-binding protein [Burkholderiaceae bacterium]
MTQRNNKNQTTTTDNHRRRIIKAGAAGLATAGTFLSVVRSSHAADAADINVKLDWLMSNGQVGDVVAQKRGFFEEQGLNVTFIPGGPNSQTVPPVLSGQAAMGQFSGSGQAMIARGNGIPLKMIGAGYRMGPFAFFSLPGAPIRKPADFVGKRVGIQPTARFVLEIIMAQHKIDPSSLEIVNIGWDMTPLVAGQVDSVTGWVTNTKALSVIGPDRIDLTQEAAGLLSYSNAYFASEDGLNKHPEIFQKYLVGASKGWEWTYHNREEAVDIMCDAHPNLDREIEKATIDTVIDLSFDAETKANGWGWFDTAKIQAQIDQYDGVGKFEKSKPTLDEFVDMSVLKATQAARPKLG